MTEENGADPGHVEPVGLGPAFQDVVVLRMNLRCRPPQDRAKRLWKRLPGCRSPVGHCFRIRKADLRQHSQLPISMNELDGYIEAEQPRQHLARHRSRQDVAADDDLIDFSGADVRQHCVEGRQVAVDVVQAGNTHALTCNRARLSSGPCSRLAGSDYDGLIAATTRAKKSPPPCHRDTMTRSSSGSMKIVFEPFPAPGSSSSARRCCRPWCSATRDSRSRWSSAARLASSPP